MPPSLAVDEFEADANRKPRKRSVGSRRRKPIPSKPGSAALDEGDMDRNVNFVSYDYFSDEDENAPVQQRSMESPLKAPMATGVAGARSVAPFDGTDPLVALTAAAAAAARSSGLSLREAAVMHPKPTVQLAARGALATTPPGPRCFMGAPPPHFMAALRAEAAAALAAPPPPPPLPPSLSDVEGQPTLSRVLPAPPPERSRHLARLDSEIGGMSVQQLKEKIRSVASTRRERLHGVAQA